MINLMHHCYEGKLISIIHSSNAQHLPAKSLYVTIFGKTDHLRAFCISRNTDLKYLMHCASPVAQYSHVRYLVCIMWLYSYHFIANSTSYLTAAGFSDGFFQLL